VARRRGADLGCYLVGGIRQRFGGRPVPAVAVAGVAVRPEARGLGAGGALMRDLVGTARESGAALAPLWGAVPRFYRRWGWGLCERALTHRVRVDALLPLRGRGEPLRDPPFDAWLPVWTEHVAGYDAAVELPAWLVEAADAEADDPDEHHHLLAWTEAGRTTGLVRFSQRRSSGGLHGVVVTDVTRFAAVTGEALRGLLHLVASSDGQGEEIVFAAGRLPARHPLLHLLPDPHRGWLRTEGAFCWMQRVTDLGVALRARGWDPRVRGGVTLAVDDPLAVEASRLRVDVEDGGVEVREGGDGELRLSAATLASWYCGALDLVTALRLGLAEGPAEAAALLDGARPAREMWLTEEF
jgi:predicted acetyltransferase